MCVIYELMHQAVDGDNGPNNGPDRVAHQSQLGNRTLHNGRKCLFLLFQRTNLYFMIRKLQTCGSWGKLEFVTHRLQL